MWDSVLRGLRVFRGNLLIRKREHYLRSLELQGLRLGKNVKFAGDIFLDPSHCCLIDVGNNVTFAPNVRLIAHDASTKQFLGFTRIGLIKIHDDCFVGDSVIFLPGVTVGPRAIIGAGSIVSKSIPADSVAVGNPARVICGLDDYLKRVRTSADQKGVLSEEYWPSNLNQARRDQIVISLLSGDGFIV